VKTAAGTRDLSAFKGASPDALWLVFGKSQFMGETGCGAVQGTAVTTGNFLDLAGLAPVALAECSGSAKATKAALVDAYRQLAQDGRVIWTISGKTLELRGATTVLTFADKGPASRLQGSAAPSS
jgi:hypothetical protein